MRLENRVNRTLNRLKSFKSRLISSGRKAVYIGLISLALAGAVKSGKAESGNNPNTISTNNNYSMVNENNLQNELIAKPELGYVIQTENETDINLLNNMLSSSGNVELKQIGGNHKNFSIVHDNNPNKTENEKTIKSLKASNQVRYAAPLFSANGETIAVIPEIVARVKDEADYSRLEGLCNSSNLIIKKKMDFTKKEYLIEVLGNDANAVFESVNTLNNTKFIEWAAPNLAFQLKLCGDIEPEQFIPNDELFPRQWHLNNTGQSGGTPNADINAPEAWAVLGGGGDPNITIAILDTGVEYNHPDLFDNIWVNKNIVTDTNLDGKIDIHDLDLDGNRFIDENELNQYGSDKGVIGWDFLEGNNSPNPPLSFPSNAKNAHGTAVAGLAAAKGNNGIGVAGVAYNCRIMPIRIASSDKFTTNVDMATAIRWAAENDADVLNNSWGYSLLRSIIHSAIKDITTQDGIGRKGKGCVILGGSGNDNPQIIFPAGHPEIIAVGATDHYDRVWGYSGHGLELEIVAPGGNIRSTRDFWTTDITGLNGFNNSYYPNVSRDYTDQFNGTSSACPIASGVAALVLSANPNLTNQEVRRILSRSAKDLGDPNWDEFYGNGRVDAHAAVKMALNPPEPFLFVDDDAPYYPEPGSSPIENGSREYPFGSIQKAINNASQGDTIIMLPGIYMGNGNHDIEFHKKSITVRSRDGPGNCIIDCQKLGRGFYFYGEEEKNLRLEGITITNGNADYGAGIMCAGYPYYTSEPTIINCIFTKNSAYKKGGGIYIYNSNNLINCTFSGNSAGENGGAIFNHVYSSPKITNCIFFGNNPEEIYAESVVLENPPGPAISATPEITYSDIKGGWSGEGNIDADPLFADPNNNDFHLKSQAGRWDPTSQSWVKDDVTSPCIDAGNPGSSLENELLNIPDKPNEEVYNSRINMGAYGGTSEASFAPYNWTLPADLTNNGLVNLEDFAAFSRYWKRTGNSLPADLNKDGKVNIADLTGLTGDWLKETEQYNKK